MGRSVVQTVVTTAITHAKTRQNVGTYGMFLLSFDIHILNIH